MAKILIQILFKVLSSVAVPFFLYLKGKSEAKNESNQERIDLVRKVNNSRSRLVSDPDTAERVRKKYTRE